MSNSPIVAHDRATRIPDLGEPVDFKVSNYS
jgi:hypothetical protein